MAVFREGVRFQAQIPPPNQPRVFTPFCRFMGSASRHQTPFSGSSAAPPLVATVASYSSGILNIWFGGELDETFMDTFDPAKYSVETPSGPRAVTSVAIGGDLKSVLLTLDSPPSFGMCSVAIAADAVRTKSGSSFAGDKLSFVGVDTQPPSVSNFFPEPGSELARNMPITFDVTDDVGVARVYIAASYNGRREAVYDPAGFSAGYAESTRSIIPGGFRFSILRTNGWPQGYAPTISVQATDNAGNVT